MKKLLISMLMLLSTFTYAQEIPGLEGLWKGEKSTYYVAILWDGDKYTFSNFSFVTGKTAKEKIYKKGKDYIVTNIYTEKTKHSINIKYTVINEQTILCEFTGSNNNVSKYKRIKLN